MNTFQDRFRWARNNAKLTQENLAEDLGISKSQISAWENGKETPSWKHLAGIRSALGVSLDSLVIGTPKSSIATDPENYDSGAVQQSLDTLADLESLNPADRQLIEQLVQRLCRG